MNFKLSRHIVIFVSFVLGLSFPIPVLAAASSEYQSCAPSSTCTVGEFLYDDEYAPIATATCTLTSRNPDGTIFLNAVPMTAGSDGWYSYAVSTSTTVGLYRSQVCCTTTAAEYLCLDKTFQVVAASGASLTAESIWNYSNRSLTDYGTLVADIWANGTRTITDYGNLVADVWGYSSRSLGTFGNLVADVWNNSTRTITGGGDTINNTYTTTNNNSGAVTTTTTGAVTNNYTSNITNTQVTELVAATAENRQLIEQIVNKPIVKTFIDESVEKPNLESKIDRTKNAATRLYAGATNIKSHVQLLALQWPILSTHDIQNELAVLTETINVDNDKKDTSVLSLSRWLKDAWGNSLTLEISDQVETINSKVESLKKNLEVMGKTGIVTYPSPLDSILTHVERLTAIVGDISQSNRDESLYGFVKYVSSLNTSLTQETEAITQVLASWDSQPESERAQTISTLTDKILTLNQVPKAESLLTNQIENNTNTLKNRLLSLLALIDTNRLLLISNVGQTIQNVWLEEGSIIFRAVVSNPSRTISQKVPLKYYLPTEIKIEQIITADKALTIEYDAAEDSLLASAEVQLAPEETRTFAIEVEDIWIYTEEEMLTYKKQAEDLVAPLKNTSFFGQGASIKSDINVILEKIMARQKQVTTPQARIRLYRESELEMVSVDEKMNTLKELISEAGSSGSIIGFVGGVQSVAVWGLIIILVTGFVFLSLYMRAIRLEQYRFATSTVLPSHNGKLRPLPPPAPASATKRATLSRARQLTKLSMLVLISGSLLTLSGSLILSSARRNNNVSLTSPQQTSIQVLGSDHSQEPK